MANLSLVVVEIISAILCFILLRFMIKPYQVTGKRQYLGLPLGFGFLGVSYLLTTCVLLSDTFGFAKDLKWLQILTQAYAFVFLAATYYFSKKPDRNTRLLWNITYASLFFVIAFSYLIVIVPPSFVLPSYQNANDTLIVTNIVFLVYISVHTIRHQIANPNSKKIWLPFAYILLAFSQYSLLFWSLDQSFNAYIGSYVLRLASLVIFVLVTYQVFYVLHTRGISAGKASA